MNDVQRDFIDTVRNEYPFICVNDELTDAIAYALSLSEQGSDRVFIARIDGKEFRADDESSYWDGKLLTGD